MKSIQFSGLVAVGFALLSLGCDSSSDGGAGGSSGTGGNDEGGAPVEGEELVNEEGWVGGDPASADDDPLGIQGSWYGYDDGDTAMPARSCEDQDTRGNPCATGECCISGTTVVDSTFTAWGCGIGLGLNESGGTSSVKSAFDGSASRFGITITGDTGGLPIRVNLTQAANTAGLVSPYKEIGAISGSKEVVVSFQDVVYPDWCKTNAGCMGLEGKSAVPTSSFDLQFQVPGGEKAAAYNFCITSVKAAP